MGCLFPKARDLGGYWANILRGRDGITEVPGSHWNPDDYYDADPKSPDRTYARRGGFLDPVDFPPLDFGIAPNNLDATDTTQLLGLLVARAALEDAGYGENSARPLDRERVSVILGVTGTLELVIPLGARLGHPVWRKALAASGVPKEKAEEVVRRIADSYVGWQENSFPGLLGNVAAGRIASRLDLNGTNCVIDAACASSLGAVNHAALELAAGRCDVALSGGLDTFNDIFMFMCFSKTPALSPTGDARPFDAGCDGTAIGEGLGVLVLKRLGDARRDGDKVYAVIRSVGSSSDGKGGAVYAPKAEGQAKALRRAYGLAGVDPSTVGLVEAHGTGTKVGDATELSALNDVYGGARPGATWCALGSVKSQIGHTKAAAGAAGLMKAALALHHKVLPPTIKVDRPMEGVGPGRSPFYLNTEARPWLPKSGHPRRAAVSAFGFGGTNYHCVLEEAEPAKAGVDWDGETQVVALSAASADALRAAAGALPRGDDWDAFRVEAARSRASFRPTDPHRLAFVARKGDDLGALLARAAGAVDAPEGAPAREGVFAGRGPVPGKLAMLFPGQGSQYVGMLRDLACRFPEMQEALADAESLGPLGDRIYPFPAFDDDTRRDQSRALQATDAAQPAIGAVSLGLARILERFGVRPDLAAGHSFGELTALCVAGRVSPADFARLARERGRLMADASAAGGGGMLAVFAPAGAVDAAVADERLGLVVANRNAPGQSVLSGPSGEVERAAAAFARRGVTAKPLAVSAAFHSPAVAVAEGPFRDALGSCEVRPSAVPVYANTTARPYPADPAEARALLAGQIARPVEFVAEVEAMAGAGVGVFLEVGPGAALTGLVRSIVGAGPGRPRAVALDASRGSRDGVADLASTLAELAALGYAVTLTRWDEPGAEALARPARKPGLTVKITGANLGPKPAPAAAAPLPTAPTSTTTTKPTKPTPTVSSPPMTTPTPPPRPRDPAPAVPPPAGVNGDAAHHPARNGNGNGRPSANGSHAPAPPPLVPIGSADPGLIGQALRQSQDNLLALQKLGEQTADLHRQFLDGQEKAHRTFQGLLDQHQRLTLASLGQAPAPAAPIAPPHPRLEPTPVRPPAVAPEPAPAPAVAPAPPALNGRAMGVLLDVVAEKTGYPAGMLEPAMALDADLGIDSIKRVEILSALQDRLPDAPAVRPEHLGTLRTLADIAAFLGAGAAESRNEPNPPAPAAEPAASGATMAVLLEVVSEKTGYPAGMLEPAMALDADLGIDSIKRVEILSALQDRLPDAPAVRPEHLGTLRTLADIAAFLGAGAAESRNEPNPPAPAAEPAASGATMAVLLEVVSEKTGYPAGMLEPAMALDADLGIDSIKRVEILSALQDRLPDAPAVRPEHLGTLRTLADIAAFLGAGAAESRNEPNPPAPAAEPAASGATMAVLLEVVSEKTGYPAGMLEPAMALDADLGIDSIKRVEILSALQDRLPDAPAVRPEHLGTLRTLADIAAFLGAGAAPGRRSEPNPGPVVTPEPATAPGVMSLAVEAVPAARSEGPGRTPLRAGAEVWVVGDGGGLDRGLADRLDGLGYAARLVPSEGAGAALTPERLDALVIVAPAGGGGDAFVADAFRWLRAAGPALRRSGKAAGARVVTVGRLDGAFGLRGVGEFDPADGGLAGLVKTAGHEWPEVSARAVDLDPALGSGSEAAGLLADEILRGGPVEVGLSRGRRETLALSARPLPDPRGGAPVRPGELVVVTGGARGVTAEVAAALAKAFRPTLALFGRSPAPEPEADWLAPLRGEPEIKRAIAARANGRASPQLVGEQFRRVAANREVARTLRRVEEAGAKAVYRPVDVRDPEAVRRAVAALSREFGPVRGLVHGAGVLADRKIADQTDAQFAEVYRTKVDGLRALLDAVGPDSLRFLALFSSSTARFGRNGQVAYAAANEVLNKAARREASRRPGCRVVSVNWGPWDGGMVTPGLKPLFEAEGVGLIGLADGARYLVDELRAAPGERPIEVVVLGAGSTPPGLPPADDPADPVPAVAPPAPAALTPVFERPLDPSAVPILRSHVIDGRGVLPLALTLEWLAQGALQRNPGLAFGGAEDLRLLKGAIHHEGRPETLTVLVGKATREGGVYRVQAELRGTVAGGQAVAHARATVLLGDRAPAPPSAAETAGLDLRDFPTYERSVRSVYHDVLFHGPDLQGLERVEGCWPAGVVASARTNPAPGVWVDRPLRRDWLSDPLAVDCAFQLMCLWCHEQTGVTSLPTGVGRYLQFRRSFPEGRVRVAVRITGTTAYRVTADMTFLDAGGAVVARVEGYECVSDPSLNQAFRRNRLGHPHPQVARSPR